MALPTHLVPTTFWEKRVALLEEAFFRGMRIIAENGTPQLASDLAMFLSDWNGLMKGIADQYPAPTPAPPPSVIIQ